MMINNITEIYELISSSLSHNTPHIIYREKYSLWLQEALSNNLIKVLTGFRRVGKSFLMKLLVDDLIKNKKIPFNNIFYINFENDLANKITNADDLRKVFNIHYLRSDKSQSYILFLDEVQNILGWEKFVRSLYEQQKYQIYLTGSNSKLLSSELSTLLSGRYISLHISPFNFKEYCLYHNIEFNNEIDHLQADSPVVNSYNDFLNNGGLPETFNLNYDFKRSYIENLFIKVMIDDIGSRFNIKNLKNFKNLFLFLLGNASGITSFRNLGRELHISATTVSTYVDYFISAYGIYSLPKFGIKLYRVFSETCKHYPVDNGFFLLSPNSTNEDQKFENLIYMHLKRKFNHNNIYFGRDYADHEIDFLIETAPKEFIKIQVVNILNDYNKKREIGNIIIANKYMKGKSILIYRQDIRRERENFRNIDIISALSFILKE